jgi:hypothetical protein
MYERGCTCSKKLGSEKGKATRLLNPVQRVIWEVLGKMAQRRAGVENHQLATRVAQRLRLTPPRTHQIHASAEPSHDLFPRAQKARLCHPLDALLTFLRHQPDVLVAIRLKHSLGCSRAMSTDNDEHEHERRGHFYSRRNPSTHKPDVDLFGRYPTAADNWCPGYTSALHG